MKHYISIAILLVACIIGYMVDAPIVYYIAILFVFLAVLILGVFHIRMNWFIQGLHAKKTTKKEIALTFDDGPTAYTAQFLDVLKVHEIKAAFFCIGAQIAKHPSIFKRIIAEGHTIGNHTYTHSPKTGFHTSSEMIREIKKCDEMIAQYGEISTPFYRPPFGVTNPNISKAIKLSGKKMVGWSVRSLDTRIADESKIIRRVEKRLHPGSIVLLHDTSQKSLNVLKDLLVILKIENYNFYQINDL